MKFETTSKDSFAGLPSAPPVRVYAYTSLILVVRNLNRIHRSEGCVNHQVLQLAAAQSHQLLVVVEDRILISQNSLSVKSPGSSGSQQSTGSHPRG